jgi:hypothetical protein
MPKLNQVIAIEKGIKSAAHSRITELLRLIQKPELFNGLTRTYISKNDEDEGLPAENKAVQYRLDDVISSLCQSQSELIDVTLQKDAANAVARADIVVDGKPILSDVPVTTLLQIEKLLIDYRTFFSQLPVLDIAETWQFDLNKALYVSEPVSTVRTKKVPKVIVRYPATPEHPAQTDLTAEDIIAGHWKNTKLSSAMPKTRKDEILRRIDSLLIAVKQAREEANDIQAPIKAGAGIALFDFLLRLT